MKLVLICRVVDNFGDAGFSLRLARALCMKGCAVHLLCDQPETLAQLLPNAAQHQNEQAFLTGLSIYEIDSVSALSDYLSQHNAPDGVLECFGSSNSDNSTINSNQLQAHWPETQWLVVDYLSAEAWVDEYHGLASINPRTGFACRYVYPGFTAHTGGLIHCDLPAMIDTQPKHATKPAALQSVFVFCYPHAPVSTLINALQPGQSIDSPNLAETPSIRAIEFCPLHEFDQLLRRYDWLFVRGEDSFIRAQLNARPLVWQIYPTNDGAHSQKLKAFFDRYTQGLPQSLKEPLFKLWWSWNGLISPSELNTAWQTLSCHYPELLAHAQHWSNTLRSGPELVSEILTFLGNKNLNS